MMKVCGGRKLVYCGDGGGNPTGRQTRATHLNAVYSSRPPDCANLKIPVKVGEQNVKIGHE